MKSLCWMVAISFLLMADVALSAPDCSKSEILCVGLVTDVGQIDDKSFNQSAWEGVQVAVSRMGAYGKFIETRDAKDYGANIELFIRNRYDIIITVGFALNEATIHAAKTNPHIHFIGIDQYQSQPLKNLAGLIFHEDRGGFLAGTLAAMLSQTGIVAAVFGTDLVPPIVMFKKGFEAGARHINSNVRVISTYHPGGLEVGFTDPEWGAATAKQAIDQGADVVFGAGGKTGNGCLVEVAAHKGKYCIGVDSDQWETLPEARPCLVSSAVKLISSAVYDLIEAAREERFPGGNYYGSIGLSPFHDFEEKIPKSIREKITQIEADVQKGILDVSLP